MAVRVEFDEKVAQWAGGLTGIDVSGPTVHAALIQIAKAYPSFRMFNCDGELRGILRVRRNGQPVGVTETLADGDTLELGVGV